MTSEPEVEFKGNVDIEIKLVLDSICNASVDVIINSTAKNLNLDNGSLSKSILNAAGPQIQQECNKKYPQGITTSKIAVTGGYNLQCKNVFHVVLDAWNEASPDIILQQLIQIITECLQTADEMGAKSIAFPILGAGVLKYPIERLPQTMYETVKMYSIINTSQIKVVNFVILPKDTEIVKKFKEYFEEIQTNEEYLSTDTWSPMGKDELLKMVELKEGKEYDDICTTFKKYLPSYRINKIERIQNNTLYDGYQIWKRKFEIENPDITNEVHSLWHGTTLKSVDGISKKGFNRSYCGKNATVYGEGVYFSNDIRYSASDTYSTPERDGTKRIFKCSVLVGKVTNGYNGLKVLPDSYNSAVDNISNPSIYVTFHDSQAYPNYLITFSSPSWCVLL